MGASFELPLPDLAPLIEELTQNITISFDERMALFRLYGCQRGGDVPPTRADLSLLFNDAASQSGDAGGGFVSLEE